MAACLARNPLEKLFGINLPAQNDIVGNKYWKTNKDKLIDYFDEYYPSKNVIREEELCLVGPVELSELEDMLSDVDIIVDEIEHDEYNAITYKIFKTVCENLSIKYHCNAEEHITLKRIITGKSYKYYISGSLLKRTIEIFRFYGANPIGGVSRFHFPPVRSITSGNNVYVLPSTTSFALTGTYIDYKWLAKGNEPRDVVLKYYIRGGQLIMNEKEHKMIKKYVEEKKEWKNLLSYFSNKGYISVNSPIFKPRVCGLSFYNEIIQHKEEYTKHNKYQYVIEDKKDVQLDNQLRYPSGHIRPISKSELIACVDQLKKSKKFS
jgi:hypothetical protein